RHWNQEQYRHNNLEDQDDSLMRNLNLLYEAHQVWLGILEKGLNPKNVYIFSEILEQAQQSYYAFMKSLEHLKELKLFLSCFGDEINARYKQIHQMVKHVQTIKISLEVLARDEMLQTRMAYNSASDLMHSLTKLVESMPNLAGASQVSDWVKTYQQVLAHSKADASNLVISEIDLRHPLLNWFQSLSRNYHD
ncbi:MAG: hypothetical protein MUO40_10025, partial [Anaerolineaceae bacterium]|nr:hypothetical protein [Anaerolineaceae bacterium]